MSQQLSRHDGGGERDFNGAAVVLPDGRELPITESMVNDALDSLDAKWRRAHQSRHMSATLR